MMRHAALLGLLLGGCQYLAVGNDDGVGPGDDDDDNAGDDDDFTDPDVPSDIDCRGPYLTPEPGDAGEGECVTALIGCGETVTGNLAGGSTVFSNQYDMAFEWCSGHGEGDELSGPERVYLLEVPEGIDVVSVRLASCENSQLLWYQTAQVCPEERLLCQYATNGGENEQWDDILLSGSGLIWFVVEGLGSPEGNFSLTVDCL